MGSFRAISCAGTPAFCAASRTPSSNRLQSNLLQFRRPTRAPLQTAFLPQQQFSSSLVATQFHKTSAFGISSGSRRVGGQRGALVVVANAKNSMGNTLRGSNRKKLNTSGFKARMATPGGRRVLKRRRTKGRKYLCPASMRKGKYVQKSKL